MSTDVLLIGGGAREHALAWKLRQSPQVGDLHIAPGNTGTATLGHNVPLDPLDFEAIAKAARERRAGLVVIGPEGPIAAGLADFFTAQDVPVFGPSRAAAQIEASKSFAKHLMAEASIPTAGWAAFNDFEAAAAHVRAAPIPPVVKADGLAAGKGVTVSMDRNQALAALREAMVDAAFGASGQTVVLEERLYGREVSAHVFSDGRTALAMPYACDHKSVYEGGAGPNTGGMGAFSPPAFVDEATDAAVRQHIVGPALRALADRGTPYRGVLYPGLMITDAGPRVVEFNCRFGDPETQVILPRLAGDVFDPLWGSATSRLDGVSLAWRDDTCVGVVLAAEGYPGPFRRGDPIEGLNDMDAGVMVFHGGTAEDERGRIVTAGGRVLTVVALGSTVEEARSRVYANAERVRFAGRHFRRDIGLDSR